MFYAKQIKFNPDGILFIAILVAVVVGVGLYFIVPIINHKKYDEQRAALKKREETFKKNVEAKEALANADVEQTPVTSVETETELVVESEPVAVEESKDEETQIEEIKDESEEKTAAVETAPVKKAPAKKASTTAKKTTTSKTGTTAKKTTSSKTGTAAKKTTTKKPAAKKTNE